MSIVLGGTINSWLILWTRGHYFALSFPVVIIVVIIIIWQYAEYLSRGVPLTFSQVMVTTFLRDIRR